jgi:hypothetical protein
MQIVTAHKVLSSSTFFFKVGFRFEKLTAWVSLLPSLIFFINFSLLVAVFCDFVAIAYLKRNKDKVELRAIALANK